MCRELGVVQVPADTNDPAVLPIDLTVGDGESMVPLIEEAAGGADVSRYLTAIVSDARRIVDRTSSAARLIERATIDPLTGLWNRRSLEMAINRSVAGDCMALLDLDHFKLVNDVHGHEVGDLVLTAFAGHLRGGLRDADVIGRLGGEEFVVVFPQIALHKAVDALSRLRASWPSVRPLPVTFSAGICAVTENSQNDELAGRAALRLADTRMYRAKESGRDRIVSTDARARRDA